MSPMRLGPVTPLRLPKSERRADSTPRNVLRPCRYLASHADPGLARAFANKPTVKPASPEFSSGPCKKRPGWTPEVIGRGNELADACRYRGVEFSLHVLCGGTDLQNTIRVSQLPLDARTGRKLARLSLPRRLKRPGN
eukprot:1240155-Amorphochlora_amoeboformis.AAC.2